MKRKIGEILMTARDPSGDVIAMVSLSQGGCGIAANDRLLDGCRFSADEADACADAFLRRVDPAAQCRQVGRPDLTGQVR